MINDDAEVVGYKYKTFSDWVTTSDEWVKEANKDIVAEDGFKYDASDLKLAILKIDRAETEIDKLLAIYSAYKYTQSIDTNDAQVKNQMVKYNAYVNEYKAKVDAANNVQKTFFPAYVKVGFGIY